MTRARDVRWRLQPSSGGLREPVAFGCESLRIGSGPEADLRIQHPSIRPLHAVVHAGESGVVVDAVEGEVSVAGAHVTTPTPLAVGQELRLGEVSFVLESVAPRRASGHISSSGGLLGVDTLGFLRTAGEEIAFAPGEVIIRRGERHDSFYAVLDGEVALVLQEDDARRRPLASLGAGAMFAAESVLSPKGAAVDAVAVTQSRVLRYPASALSHALGESPSLRDKLLGGVARHLHYATTDALDLLHGTDVIARLVQGEEEPRDLLATSARMRSVNARIARCAGLRGPVLIVGEPGTGKTLAARRLHEVSARAAGPVIAVDCARLGPERAGELILGSHDDDARGAPRRNGGVHLAHGGTLVLRNVDTLPAAVQEDLAAYLEEAAARQPGTFPDTRVVATARTLIRGPDGAPLIQRRLMECFISELIHIPPLAERPRDIIPLAESMLERLGDEPPRLSDSGRHALLAFDYRHRNVAELADVVTLAARCAPDGVIRAEHIFSGRGEEEVPAGVDVTSSGLVDWLVRRRGVRLLRWVTGVGFTAVVALGLALPASAPARAANGLVWWAWEPLVFALFLFAGPLWCTVCPLSGAGRAVQGRFGLERPQPAWIVRFGPALSVVGFALVVWSERAFHMGAHPRATSFLLIALVVASVAACVVYAREVWCRHLCPLGRLAVALAPASPLQLTARRQVCASSCRSHDCFRGTETVPGCTVFHHPLESSQAHQCKLCLDCLLSCPHGSVSLQVRPPLVAVSRLDERSSGVAAFALAVSLMAPALLLPRAFPVLARPLPLAIIVAAAGGLGLALHRLLMARSGAEGGALTVRRMFALMILGWGALMADQLGNVGVLADARIAIDRPLPGAPLGLDTAALPLLQTLAVLLAGALALLTLSHARKQPPSGEPRRRWLWSVAFLLYGALTLALVWRAAAI